MSAEDSDDSDEWGMEELVLPAATKAAQDDDASSKDKEKCSEDFWAQEPVQESESKTVASSKTKPKEETKDDRPMIIVDMTLMTKETIHSKFDRNSVNDAEAASALRKQIEQDYERYAKDATLLGDGTVIPCGMSVWRGALSRLRDERPGHYFAPIFPLKK